MNNPRPYLHIDYGYLPPEAARMMTEVQERGRLALEKDSTLAGEALLEAIAAPAEAEICNNCGALYHADYTGCYFDPDDCGDLVDLFGEAIRLLPANTHYCDYNCLFVAVEYEKVKQEGGEAE